MQSYSGALYRENWIRWKEKSLEPTAETFIALLQEDPSSEVKELIGFVLEDLVKDYLLLFEITFNELSPLDYFEILQAVAHTIQHKLRALSSYKNINLVIIEDRKTQLASICVWENRDVTRAQ